MSSILEEMYNVGGLESLCSRLPPLLVCNLWHCAGASRMQLWKFEYEYCSYYEYLSTFRRQVLVHYYIICTRILAHLLRLAIPRCSATSYR